MKADQLPFPLDIRASMVVWNKLFFTSGPFKPDADKSAEWNRGAFLVEGPGHCGMCHTPKNFLGGDKTSERLQGYALQGWFAPNITNNSRVGLGSWSVDDIVAYLKTGHKLDRFRNRADVGNAQSFDLAYERSGSQGNGDLSQGPARQGAGGADRPEQVTMNSGAQIYADECAGCHVANGKGATGLFPSLRGSPAVQQTDPTSLLRVVLRGARSVGTDPAPTAPAMPAFSWVLNDDQVAAVVTYIRNAWGNAAPAVSESEVGKARRDTGRAHRLNKLPGLTPKANLRNNRR